MSKLDPRVEKTFLKPEEYLKLIGKHPVEIIAFLPLVASVCFGYKYYSTGGVIDGVVCIVTFVISALLLMYIFKLKSIRPHNSVKHYPSVYEVGDAVKEIFKNISTDSEITQTYIKNNFLAGSQDNIFKDVTIDIKDGGRRPKINRIFILFDPLDINFAEHSSELSNGMSIYRTDINKISLNNIFIGNAEGEEKIINIIPNITMADGKVLVTFPSRLSSDDRFPKKLIVSQEGPSTRGVEVEDVNAYNEYKKYLKNIKSDRLDSIKFQFFNKDKVGYYYSIIFSIAKELLHADVLEDKILFLGIVGSLANYVEKRNCEEENVTINDLDLQIIVSKLSPEIFLVCKEICQQVCKRFCISEQVNFFVETRYSPIKQSNFNEGVQQIPIHLILSDQESCKDWDKFIAIDRIRHGGNVTFEWVLDNNGNRKSQKELNELVKSSIRDNRIRFCDLISDDYLYSISNCISVLDSTDNPLSIKEWIKDDKGNYNLRSSKVKLSPLEYAQFAKYSLKWGVINFYNSEENHYINNNSYSRNFENALLGVNQILPDIKRGMRDVHK